MKLAMELIEKGKIQILKGNISELLAIAGQPFHGTGIDAGVEDAMTGDNEEERKEIFRKVSKKTGSVLLATGARDLLVDQEPVSDPGKWCAGAVRDHRNRMYGRARFRRLSWRRGIRLSAALLGTSVMGIAGEIAAKRSKGPGSFQMELLDAVAGLTQEELEARIRIREIGI
ncbi:MAG: hydroxyethylthiazole kinase [Lachnospiraceae bacterium]